MDGDRGRVEVGSEQLANGIRTTWRTEQAHGSNTFELQDGGQQLVVRSTLVVTAISGVDPIAYVERFERTAEAPGSQPAAGND